MVQRGEWTSYGDISHAATGSPAAARLVGRLAATNDAFPNAQRVLRKGGHISPDWHGGGGGPEVCEAMLREEGIDFVAGKAVNGRITWQVIQERLRASGGERWAGLSPDTA